MNLNDGKEQNNIDIDLLHSIFYRIVSAYEKIGIYLFISNNDNKYKIAIRGDYNYPQYKVDICKSNKDINKCLLDFILGKIINSSCYGIFDLINLSNIDLYLILHTERQEFISLCFKMLHSDISNKLRSIGYPKSLEECMLKMDIIGF